MPLFPTGHKAMEKYEYDYLIHFLGLSTMSQLRTPACTKKNIYENICSKYQCSDDMFII
jgi:hypothetical protein